MSLSTSEYEKESPCCRTLSLSTVLATDCKVSEAMALQVHREYPGGALFRFGTIATPCLQTESEGRAGRPSHR